MRNFLKSWRTPFAAPAALALALSACVVEEAPVDNGTPPSQDPSQDPGQGNSGASTVVGVDVDQDGLRDDAQISIYASSASDPVLRKASIQLAKSLQKLIVTGTTSSNALAAAITMNKAIDCMYSLDADKFGGRVETVEAAVVNTASRAQAYAQAGAFLSGGNFTVSTTADNAASCEANP